MQKQLEERLKVLRDEYETGQKNLAEFETEASNLRNTMLRISGAIQVLEEELAKANETPQAVSQSADSSNEKSGTPLRSVSS